MTDGRHRARAGADRWLVSYADLMTLLLAFFATAYAVSDLNASKMTPAASAIRRALGGQQVATATPEAAARPETTSAAAASVGDALERVFAEEIASGRLEVVTAGAQTVLSLPEAASFPSGSADVGPDVDNVLARFVDVLSGGEQAVRVEGHTDDVPIASSRFRSNWELSTARASAVVARLVDRGINPARLSAAGYGEFHPRVPNDSDASRAVNRRVDIVLVPSSGDGGASGNPWGLRP